MEVAADPQREAVYAAEGEMSAVSHDLRSIDEVRAFLDEAMRVIGEKAIRAELCDLSDERLAKGDLAAVKAKLASGQPPRAWGLAIAEERTILIVDAGQKVLSNGLNVLHEATHVLVPTAVHHGAEFTRSYLDLLRRYGPYQLVAAGLESALRVRRVAISLAPSPLADGSGGTPGGAVSSS